MKTWGRESKRDASVTLGSLPDASQLWAPPIVIEDGVLVPQLAGSGSGRLVFLEPEVEQELLESFLNLADPCASEDDFARFASSWGLLDICEHGLPGRATFTPSRLVAGLRITAGHDAQCWHGVASPEP